jgi:hypothetical protein
MKRIPLIIFSVVIILAALLSLSLFTNRDDQKTNTLTSDQSTQSVAPVENLETDNSTERQLLYLIEEEKLAHDVYKKMGEIYGSTIFDNIQNSEISHQDQVLNLLSAKSIPDPRSSEIGVFANQELQALYDELVARGATSVQEAFRVGIIIEEKDIVDLTAQLAVTSDPTIVQTLETLKRGSEYHLQAFTRQLRESP